KIPIPTPITIPAPTTGSAIGKISPITPVIEVAMLVKAVVKAVLTPSMINSFPVYTFLNILIIPSIATPIIIGKQPTKKPMGIIDTNNFPSSSNGKFNISILKTPLKI
ncbi:hypothetical protein, partial [Dorea formicigenerans]|uniref:hypothetical protein n=1 Tax=Dorea formicigenerans TaxID=39486 RepID=UPI001A9A664D